MVVRLRFSLHGQRNNKLLHLVVINARKRRDANPIETVGIYKPRVAPSETKNVEWSVARIKYWLDVGAQPSKSVVRLLTEVRILAVESFLTEIFCQGGILPPDSKYHPKPIVRGPASTLKSMAAIDGQVDLSVDTEIDPKSVDR